MPLIIPSNSISAGGYEVDNSLRFDDGSSDYLNRTTASTGNRKTFTISYWGKRGNLTLSGTSTALSSGDFSTGDNHTYVGFQLSTDTARIQNTVGGSTVMSLISSALYRDVSAWYHFVWKVDTTQATESNRVKLYVNGVEQTISGTYPAQNQDTFFGYADTYRVGVRFIAQATYWDGYLAEVCYVDGTALEPTSFGEFDEDSGIWKPIDVSGLTFGTNGFYLDFENSGSLGADVSGNGNNFTVNNLTAIDQTTDTPTNNFATLNPLNGFYTAVIFSEGNLDVECTSGSAHGGTGNIGVNTGKWYYEAKLISQSGSATSNSKFGQAGFYNIEATTDDSTNQSLSILADGRVRGQGSTTGIAGSSIWGVGDILMFALDLDNGNMYVGKNGNWRASDGDFDVTFDNASALFSSIATTNSWTFYLRKNVTADNTIKWSLNSGSPSFAISSGNSDGNSIGNFEYPVPDGYFALCTSNLAEHG